MFDLLNKNVKKSGICILKKKKHYFQKTMFSVSKKCINFATFDNAPSIYKYHLFFISLLDEDKDKILSLCRVTISNYNIYSKGIIFIEKMS